MVGAGRRKRRFPRKILRVILSDGSCQLQPQSHEFTTIKEEQLYGSENSPIYYKSEDAHQRSYQENYVKEEDIYHSPSPHVNGNHELNGYPFEFRKRSPRPYIDSENHYYGPESPHGFINESRISDCGNRRHRNKQSPIQEKEKPKEESLEKLKSKQDLTTRASYKHQHPEPTPEFPYQCETCDMLFKTMDLLIDHQTTVHDNNRQFACRYCSKRFNDKYNMRKHVLIHVGEKRHKCQFCEKAFLRKDHLRSHLQTHYNRKFGCKICGKGYRTMELYQRHLKSHKDDSYMSMMNNADILEPEICSITAENLKKKSNTNLVESNVARDDDVAVTILDDDFNVSSPWDEGSLSMSENDMSLASSPQLNEQSPSDMPQLNGSHDTKQKGPYVCHNCKLTFSDMHCLQGHQQNCGTVIDNPGSSWQCMKCNIVFDEATTLKQHYEKVHSIDKPVQSPSRWRCKTCNINYPNSKELSRHYTHAHKDAQIFPCSECPKTFTVWHNLKKHMLIHLGDKKHKCAICDKGFVRKDHLNSHMKVHLGEGSKFTCPICSKVFRLKQMYFKHMNLHGLEKAYTVVDSKFPNEGN